MRPFLNVSTSPSKIFALACLGLCLLLSPAVTRTLAVAAENQKSPAGEISQAGYKKKKAALAAAVAERVKAKAEFTARIAPMLSAEGKTKRPYGNDFALVVDNLWRLRLLPEIQREWIDKLLDTASPDRYRDFAGFMDAVEYAAVNITFEREKKIPRKPSTLRKQDAVAKLEQTLERKKLREECFASAALLVSLDPKGNVRHDLKHAELFWALRDNPETLKLGAAILEQGDLPWTSREMLLDMLRTSPQKAGAALKTLAARQAAVERYTFALNHEGPSGPLGFPVDSILPGIGARLAKNLTLPLAASNVTRPPRGLGFERLQTLFPERNTARAGQEKETAPERPSFLKEGERLYAVLSGRFTKGVRIFAGTPLDQLADASPVLVEYTADTARDIERLSSSARYIRRDGRSWYLLAASCGPEEMAAHLASLAVMEGERGRSLCDPDRSDGNKKTSPRPDSLKNPGEYPQDIPGKALRVVDLRDPQLFFTLSGRADGMGIARLMGPIRGVWMRDDPGGATPWHALRYDSVSPMTAVPGSLATSKLLSLDTTALQSLAAARHERLVVRWAHFLAAREAGKNNEKIAEIRKAKETLVAADVRNLESKGIVAPFVETALSLLYRDSENTALTARLKAIIDDVTVPAPERISAMRNAPYELGR